MTDEMRVALVAVATGQGMAVEDAWALVDEMAAEHCDARGLTAAVYARSTGESYGAFIRG